MTSLTEQQLLNYLGLKIAEARFSTGLDGLEAKQMEAVMQQARRQYNLEEKVLASPEAQAIYLPEATLEDAWLRVRERYETQEAFQGALDKIQMSEEGYRAALERELRIEAILEKVSSQAAQISDEEALAFYHKHPDKFFIPEKRQTRHLLITVEETAGDSGELLVLQECEAIRAQLVKRPERFSELALRHSQCPTAVEGGQLGKVPPGLLYDELDKALFQMEEGEISAPLRSPLGYHLLYCEAILPSECKSFAEARSKIVEYLADSKRSQAQKQWIRQLG
ncbi:nitrogen fixation protein NifM [Marinospirillum perlucidum]|uniref:nitrogen fixation protein NifM n=1 Tax=Marinospirillum perlucidum TaxID=1982602 RepID=UPI00138FE786|nr:nitrogen fixation protein NifM [Marinospirillum perlucidum]